jgi:outer membrane protein insertion porin family
MLFNRGLSARLGVSASALALTVAFAVPALAQSIVVQGNRSVDSDTIKGYFVDGDHASAVRKLKDSGMFSDVRVSQSGGRTVVTVRENQNQQRINRVAFEGNSKIKAEVLAPEMRNKTRGTFSQSNIDADVAKLREIYRYGGRSDATITARTVPLPNGKIDVVYTIKEGDKTGVKSINFVGNQVYSSGRLRDQMETTEMNFMSFLKTSDVYDPDKVAADLERVRRYYLKNGYADFRIVSTESVYDAAQKGYVINVVVDEGPQYRIGGINVESRLAEVDGNSLRDRIRVSPGDIYDGTLVEKSVEGMSKEAARRGYAFNQVRPRGNRDMASRTVNLDFIVEDGPRVYVEKIVVRGNTRTRDYVIRREFDMTEGDAYNRVLVDKAERRLNNLGFFKKVRITNEPGSAPDRVIVNVDVEDQATGSFSISGGYSTTDGLIGEVSVSESNFLGRGQFARLALSGGTRARGVEFSFTEPYFLDRRIAAGFDIYHKQTDASRYSFYENWVTGATVRFGLPITEEITFSPRYSLYQSRIRIPNDAKTGLYNDCTVPIPGKTPGTPGAPALDATHNCLTNGEASLALKEAAGTRLTSMIGYSLSYNTLDNMKNPTSGILAELRQDVAGLGGDSRFVRTTGDVRVYREIFDRFVGIARMQGGHITAFGGKDLRIVDNFNLGPSLVRGFAPGGIGPRDVSPGINSRANAIGGTKYVGGSLEVQFPFFGLPRDLGLKAAVFADAGALWGYEGRTNFATYAGYAAGTPCVAMPAKTAPLYKQGGCITVGGDSTKIRSSVGASLIWNSPMGPIRFDFARALSKDKADVTQFFRFSGGTSF